MDCRAGKASAPNRLLKARTKGLGDCLAASAGVAGPATDSVMGCNALARLASLSGFTGVPIGSGGLGVSTAALGMAAPVLPTTIRAVPLPRRCAGKSIEGWVVPTAPFIGSDAGFAGGFGASAEDRRFAAEETCEAICVPSGRTDTFRAGSGSLVCPDAWEANPCTARAPTPGATGVAPGGPAGGIVLMSAGVSAVWPLRFCALAISLAGGATDGVVGAPPLSARAELIRAIPANAIAICVSFCPWERSCAASPANLCCHHLRKSSTSRVRGSSASTIEVPLPAARAIVAAT
jgi:hypothetical protein